MSKNGKRRRRQVGDELALKLQQLKSEGKLQGDAPLLRIDNRRAAAEAPFVFDAAENRMHRKGCRAIPGGSKTALYGVWEIGPGERELACPRCKPVPKKKSRPTAPSARTSYTASSRSCSSSGASYGSAAGSIGRVAGARRCRAVSRAFTRA